MNGVTITIPESAFKILSKWASISRTLDAVETLISDYVSGQPLSKEIEEQGNYILDEIQQIKPALDYINHACKHFPKICYH
jgi:hypothetical protein